MFKLFFSRKNKIKTGLILGLLFIAFLPSTVQAQLQIFNFSGNDAESYQCFDDQGLTYLNGEDGPNGAVVIYKDDATGFFLCDGFDYDGISGDDRAILRPPALQQVEIWFVRILYVIWAAVGSFSFFLLVGLGFEYLLRGGTSDTELVKLRKRIINYIIGFILVFLAVPILSTIFRLLGVNDAVACYNVNMPAFQFFFTDVCNGNETLLRNACQNGTPIDAGLACSPPGLTVYCTQDDQGNAVITQENPDGNVIGGNMYFICSVGNTAGATQRSTWVQYVPGANTTPITDPNQIRFQQ